MITRDHCLSRISTSLYLLFFRLSYHVFMERIFFVARANSLSWRERCRFLNEQPDCCKTQDGQWVWLINRRLCIEFQVSADFVYQRKYLPYWSVDCHKEKPPKVFPLLLKWAKDYILAVYKYFQWSYWSLNT